MAEQPKTLSLGPREWNVLLAHNASELVAFFNHQPQPTVDLYKQIIQHMERMKEILPGWLACAPAVAPDAPNQQAQGEQAQVPQPNGAAPQERKKGGWPKGRKRTRAAPAQAVQ